MGMNDPKGFDSKPFSETFQYGQPFKLQNATVVQASSREYGEGEMVILSIETAPGTVEDFSIWGVYIVRQVKSADRSDFGKMWTLGETQLPNGRTAKALIPAGEANRQGMENVEIPY